ncbi:MAG: hypothetical protein HN337_02695 [Deltaproteobacteria bacterium]|jgi:hypothetical protein|nr:hypothetical protein [Deltaproteobacteria bacterium]
MTLEAFSTGSLPAQSFASTSFTMAMQKPMRIAKVDPQVMPARVTAGHDFYGSSISSIYDLSVGTFPTQPTMDGLPMTLRWSMRKEGIESRAASLLKYAQDPATKPEYAVRAAVSSALYSTQLTDFPSSVPILAANSLSEAVNIASNMSVDAVGAAVAMKNGGDWVAGQGDESLAQPFYIAAAELLSRHLEGGDSPANRHEFLARVDALQYASAAAFLGKDWRLMTELSRKVGDAVQSWTQADRDDTATDDFFAGAYGYTLAAYYLEAMFEDREGAHALATNAAFLFGRLSSVGEDRIAQWMGGQSLDIFAENLVFPFGKASDKDTVAAGSGA